jgi:hypothetical protein
VHRGYPHGIGSTYEDLRRIIELSDRPERAQLLEMLDNLTGTTGNTDNTK